MDYARNTPKKNTVAITTVVVETTSSLLGHVTCFISTRTSCMNSRVSAIVPLTRSPIPAAAPVMALLLEETRKRGVTLVLVTHDEALAGRVADRVLRMTDGRLEGG